MTDPRRDLADELLVLACLEGRTDAFRELFERWNEPLWRHAYRLLGRDDGASDALQDAWIAIASGIGRLRDPGSFRRWAYKIVTRRAADWLGANRNSAESALDDEIEADTEPESAVEALRLALRRLPRDRRVLLTLRYLDGFELSEVAEILGVPEGTVKSRLHHARNELRAIVERMER